MDNMYIIYRGSFGDLPEKDEQILYAHESEKYMDGLKEIGYDLNKIYYTRGCMSNGIQFFDFGSHTIFVALGTKEQLGGYFKKG